VLCFGSHEEKNNRFTNLTEAHFSIPQLHDFGEDLRVLASAERTSTNQVYQEQGTSIPAWPFQGRRSLSREIFFLSCAMSPNSPGERRFLYAPSADPMNDLQNQLGSIVFCWREKEYSFFTPRKFNVKVLGKESAVNARACIGKFCLLLYGVQSFPANDLITVPLERASPDRFKPSIFAIAF